MTESRSSSYKSIDALQKTLAGQVFHYAANPKKAAGRALGTLVEIITYYILRTWGLSDHIVIERKVPEFGNSKIVHNVEFSLHPVLAKHRAEITPLSLPITPRKLRHSWPCPKDCLLKSSSILDKDLVKRNATVLAEIDSGPVVANIEVLDKSACTIFICELTASPFAIVECKRVGVEEGMRKGPQTIEKAKQGSYVARSVSSLQKVRLRSGQFQGILEQNDGQFRSGPYHELQREIINAASRDNFTEFMLTIGIVSNHGNWFTSDNQNKELRVLAQSYDWLLFLTDNGLTKFIVDLLLQPADELKSASAAFHQSYSGQRGNNRFTKIRIDTKADRVLRAYFTKYESRVETWFNVIAPDGGTLTSLRADLGSLAK
ncbi:MAG: hypothetical protein OXF67_09485 [Cyanobacteria bacterium MAG CAR4_bin_6]|nr:hypothetical protein [Cyanobacteria bacterium MAG CAR4_bin_6]